jgi:hypothetical protein
VQACSAWFPTFRRRPPGPARCGNRAWAIEVPELGNVTQARNVPEIEVMARDLIEIMTDTTDFAMDIQLQLPPEVE